MSKRFDKKGATFEPINIKVPTDDYFEIKDDVLPPEEISEEEKIKWAEKVNQINELILQGKTIGSDWELADGWVNITAGGFIRRSFKPSPHKRNNIKKSVSSNPFRKRESKYDSYFEVESDDTLSVFRDFETASKRAKKNGGIIRRYQGKRCPCCSSSDLANIIYGFPVFSDTELMDKHQRKEVVFGGCAIRFGEPMPSKHCNHCQHKFYHIILLP